MLTMESVHCRLQLGARHYHNGGGDHLPARGGAGHWQATRDTAALIQIQHPSRWNVVTSSPSSTGLQLDIFFIHIFCFWVLSKYFLHKVFPSLNPKVARYVHNLCIIRICLMFSRNLFLVDSSACSNGLRCMAPNSRWCHVSLMLYTLAAFIAPHYHSGVIL